MCHGLSQTAGLYGQDGGGGEKGREKGRDHVLVKIHTVISFYGWRSYQSIRRVNQLNHKYEYWLDQ